MYILRSTCPNSHHVYHTSHDLDREICVNGFKVLEKLPNLSKFHGSGSRTAADSLFYKSLVHNQNLESLLVSEGYQKFFRSPFPNNSVANSF